MSEEGNERVSAAELIANGRPDTYVFWFVEGVGTYAIRCDHRTKDIERLALCGSFTTEEHRADLQACLGIVNSIAFEEYMVPGTQAQLKEALSVIS